MDSLDKRTVSSPINGRNGGVKTEEGKAVSSLNSTKHGILANFSTDLDDLSFEEAYSLYAAEFGDETVTRQTLISQLAILHIRLRRCARFESEFIMAQLHPPKYESKLVEGSSLGLKLAPLDDTYAEVLVDPGMPEALKIKSLVKLENVYLKYEPQFLGRFCRIIEILTRGDK